MPNVAPVRDALGFVRLVLQHPSPPLEFRKLHRSLWSLVKIDASSPMLAAEQLRRVADRVLGECDYSCSGQVLEMALRALSLRFDDRPSENMLCVDLGMMAAGISVVGIDDEVPEWSSRSLVPGPMSPGIVREWVQVQVSAICERAFLNMGRELAFENWSSSDAECALLALRMNYCLFNATIEGLCVVPTDLLADFDARGTLLWEALENQLRTRPEHGAISRLQRLSSWHSASRMLVRRALDEIRKGSPGRDRASATELAEEGDRLASVSPPPTLAKVIRAEASLVVCRTPIVATTSKEERAEVERHRVLESPLPLAPMPHPWALLEMRQSLLAEFPWADEPLSVIFADLVGRAKLGVPTFAIPPTLLVGAPGSGKSRFIRRLSDAFHLPTMNLSLGGVSDTKVLGGTSRGWSSAKPSDLATLMALRKSASALVLLDELDKAHDGNGMGGVGLQSYLLGFMEPETANRLMDSYLKTECDYTGVMWLGTANSLSSIHAPLLSRLRILLLRQPSVEHFRVIAENVLVDLAKSWSLDRQVLPALRDLHLPWDRLSSARQVRNAVEAAVTDWASELQRH